MPLQHETFFCCALLVLAAFSLQGCSDESLSPAQFCPALKEGGGVRVAESSPGEIVKVSCPDGWSYTGPDLECSWVNRFCMADDNRKLLSPDLCWNQYRITKKGEGLKEWPRNQTPQMLPPPAPNNADTGLLSRRLANMPRIVTAKDIECTSPDAHPQRVQLTHAKVVRNNLRGFGPDGGTESTLRYSKIAVMGESNVDLIVSASDAYFPARVYRNGKGDSCGRINIQGGHGTVKLNFKLVDSTDKPVVFPELYITALNIGKKGEHTIQEDVLAEGIVSYFISDQTHLSVVEDRVGQYRFSSIASGYNLYSGQSWSQSVSKMWEESVRSSVLLEFRNVSEFTLGVRITRQSYEGQDFEFTGWSELFDVGSRVLCERSAYFT